MQLNIEGKNLKITEAINDYVKQKIKKVNNHFNQILFAQVTLETIKRDHYAEVTLSSGNNHFHNKIRSEDLYKSIDLLFDKIERQVRRYKENQNDKIQKTESLSAHLQELSDLNKASKNISEGTIEIKDKEIPFTPMSDLEAVMQLQQHDNKEFFAYINEHIDKSPSFVLKEKSDEKTERFTLISFSDFWEEKEVDLLNNNDLRINHIILLKPPLEFIENAVDYLEHHEEQRFRLFISMRTEKIMFLFKKKPGNYTLVREKV